jgi:hypothetical protein
MNKSNKSNRSNFEQREYSALIQAFNKETDKPGVYERYYLNGYIWEVDQQNIYRRYYLTDVMLNCDRATVSDFEKAKRLGEKI